jgi:hypothetical protein
MLTKLCWASKVQLAAVVVLHRVHLMIICHNAKGDEPASVAGWVKDEAAH